MYTVYQRFWGVQGVNHFVSFVRAYALSRGRVESAVKGVHTRFPLPLRDYIML